MDTEHLKIFVEVVQQGSFAAAARQFDIDPSAVTRAIARQHAEYMQTGFLTSARQSPAARGDRRIALSGDSFRQ
jgi:DNA-binding transcriptional LysR family regulator